MSTTTDAPRRGAGFPSGSLTANPDSGRPPAQPKAADPPTGSDRPPTTVDEKVSRPEDKVTKPKEKKEKKEKKNRVVPPGARLPRTPGLAKLKYAYACEFGFPDKVPLKLSPKDIAYYDALEAQQAAARALEEEFAVLCGKLIYFVRTKKMRMNIMAVNQHGTAGKTWASSYLACLLGYITAVPIGYVEMRHDDALAAQMLGIDKELTLTTRELWQQREKFKKSGVTLTDELSSNGYGVWVVRTKAGPKSTRLDEAMAGEVMDIVNSEFRITFADPGNSVTDEANIGTAKKIDVFIVVSLPSLDRAELAALTVESLRDEGISLTPQNSFYMLNMLDANADASDWRQKLQVPEGVDLLTTHYDPGADKRKLSEPVGTDLRDLQVDLGIVKMLLLVELARALVKAFELKASQADVTKPPVLDPVQDPDPVPDPDSTPTPDPDGAPRPDNPPERNEP